MVGNNLDLILQMHRTEFFEEFTNAIKCKKFLEKLKNLFAQITSPAWQNHPFLCIAMQPCKQKPQQNCKHDQKPTTGWYMFHSLLPQFTPLFLSLPNHIARLFSNNKIFPHIAPSFNCKRKELCGGIVVWRLASFFFLLTPFRIFANGNRCPGFPGRNRMLHFRDTWGTAHFPYLPSSAGRVVRTQKNHCTANHCSSVWAAYLGKCKPKGIWCVSSCVYVCVCVFAFFYIAFIVLSFEQAPPNRRGSCYLQ